MRAFTERTRFKSETLIAVFHAMTGCIWRSGMAFAFFGLKADISEICDFIYECE